jgi:Ca2+-binding RTX toxin-like protein
MSNLTFGNLVLNPFGLSNIGTEEYAKPTFVDIDADGDLDMFVGTLSGDTVFFENSGDAYTPSFSAPETNPFGLADVGFSSSPTFADIDGDGDLDAFIGDENGDLNFFENIGSASNPVFTTAQLNPFGFTKEDEMSKPVFADIDGDGDLDLFVGTQGGDILFYENEGDTTNPSFAPVEVNPFGLSNVGIGGHSDPSFVDIDSDGDLDALVGSADGDVLFYQNIGTTTSPSFIAPLTNPFGLTNAGYSSSPVFVDIDSDGDLDAFIGNAAGDLVFYRADNTAIIVNLELSANSATESEMTEIIISVVASSALATEEVFNISVSGTVNTEDYILSDEQITIAAGESRGSATFTVVDDSLAEVLETATITLSLNSASLSINLGSIISQDIVITSNDFLGNSRNNIIVGTDGNDSITGLKGRDTLTGGLGSDTFIYTSPVDAGDWLTDFEVGVDKIDLSQVLMRIGYTGTDPLADQYVQIVSHSLGSTLKIDPDGVGSALARNYIFTIENVTPAELNNPVNFIF